MSDRSSAGYGFRRFALIGACTLTLAACGGGGGGGGASAGGFSYTGSTAQAAIDETNAAALAGGAFVTGDAGASANVVGVAASGSAVQQRSVKVANALRDAVRRIDFLDSSSTAVSALQQESNTVTGPCGGSFSYSISVDDQTGSFSGMLDFSSFCQEPGDSISGQVSFSGQIDLNTLQFVSLQFTATALGLADNGKDFAINGTITFAFAGASATITENFDIRDGSGKVYRVQNLVVALTTGTSETQEMLSGRFYHPDYGYVDVTTTAVFHIPTGSDFPVSGSLTVTGTGGKAMLTALSGSQYQLDIDADGDDTFEKTVIGNWADL